MMTQHSLHQHKIEQLISEADKASTRLRDDPGSTQRISEYQQAKAELQRTVVELREALEAVLPKPEMATPDFNSR